MHKVWVHQNHLEGFHSFEKQMISVQGYAPDFEKLEAIYPLEV